MPVLWIKKLMLSKTESLAWVHTDGTWGHTDGTRISTHVVFHCALPQILATLSLWLSRKY